MEVEATPKFEYSHGAKAERRTSEDSDELVLGDLKTQEVRDWGNSHDKLVRAHLIYQHSFFWLELKLEDGTHGQCRKGFWTFSLDRTQRERELCEHTEAKLHTVPEMPGFELFCYKPHKLGSNSIRGCQERVQFCISADPQACECNTYWVKIVYTNCQGVSAVDYKAFYMLSYEAWEAVHKSGKLFNLRAGVSK